MGKQAIRVHMDEALVAEVDGLADREDRSRNWTINDLVRRGLVAHAAEEGLAYPVGALTDQAVLAAEEEIQRSAVRPTLDQRRAEKQPHRHRYTTEVEGTRTGRHGRTYAMLSCECGDEAEREIRDK